MAKFGKWVPVKWIELNEEKHGADISTHIADFELPDDGDDIIISRRNGKWVQVVTFYNDECGIRDSNDDDWLHEVDAWMPLPEGYKRSRY